MRSALVECWPRGSGPSTRRKPGCGSEPEESWSRPQQGCKARGRPFDGGLGPDCRSDGKGTAHVAADSATALCHRRTTAAGSGFLWRVHQENGPQAHIFPLALPLCVVYAQLGFTRLFNNSLGAEGMGIQLYFLSPTPIRTVLLAKNLFHSAVFALTILVAVTLAILRLGVPDEAVLAATVAWLLFSVPANLAVEKYALTLPYGENPGRVARTGRTPDSSLLDRCWCN